MLDHLNATHHMGPVIMMTNQKHSFSISITFKKPQTQFHPIKNLNFIHNIIYTLFPLCPVEMH